MKDRLPTRLLRGLKRYCYRLRRRLDPTWHRLPRTALVEDGIATVIQGSFTRALLEKGIMPPHCTEFSIYLPVDGLIHVKSTRLLTLEESDYLAELIRRDQGEARNWLREQDVILQNHEGKYSRLTTEELPDWTIEGRLPQ